VRWRKAGPPRDTDTDTFAGNETVVTAKLGETKTMPTGRRTGPKPGGKENERWETSDRLRFHFLFTWPEKCGEAPRIIGSSLD